MHQMAFGTLMKLLGSADTPAQQRALATPWAQANTGAFTLVSPPSPYVHRFLL